MYDRLGNLALIIAPNGDRTAFNTNALGETTAVIEDYVHAAGVKVLSLLLLRFLYVLFGGASIFAILRVAFGS